MKQLSLRLLCVGTLVASLPALMSACVGQPRGDASGGSASSSGGRTVGSGGSESGAGGSGTESGGSGGTSHAGGKQQGSGGAAGGQGGEVSSNGGGSGGDVGCDSASAEGACSDDGAVCGGPCQDPCGFCSLLRCTSGTWQRLEIAPAPCAECGDSLRCNILGSYCSVRDDAVRTCEVYPDECTTEPSCGCLEGAIANSECSGTAEDGFVVESSSPIVHETVCSCTVTRSGSGWCTPSASGVDEAHSVEWVCGATASPLDELNRDCVGLPTGAARWCCEPEFEPDCEE